MPSVYLPVLLLGQVVGIVAGGAIARRPAEPVLLVAVVLLLASVALVRRPWLHLALLALAAAAAGAGATLATRAPRGLRACSVAHQAHRARRAPVYLEAVVLAAPTTTAWGRRVLLRAQGIRGRSEARPACGNVELRLYGASAPLWSGERILVRARMKPALAGRNPGVPSPRLRLLSGGVAAVAHADAGSLVVLGPRDPPPLARLRARVRRALEVGVTRPTPRAILAAMVLGDRHAVDRALRERFSRAGVSHLLAVSGLHLSFVAGGAMLIFTLLLRRVTCLARRVEVRQIAAPLAGAVAVGYTLLTGAAPSTVRACVMASAVLFGLVASRSRDFVRPLCLAALLLLAADPLNLARPGFQLSFAAVAGIALVARWRSARPARRSTGRLAGGIARLLRGARDLALTTTAATLVTAPVVAHHFGQFSAAGLMTNMVAIPATTVALLPLGLLGALLGAVDPALGAPPLSAAAGVAQLLDRLCGVAADLDVAVIQARPGWLVTLGLCALVVAALSGRPWRRLASALGLLLLLASALLAVGEQVRRPLEVTFIDVGQGESTFIRLPDGAALLVDAGGARRGTGWDPGATRVVPLLRAAGVERLDLVVASHPHADHVAGLVAVLESIEVTELWTCWHGEPNRWHDRLIAAARARGVPVQRPRIWRRGGVVLRPIWPLGPEGPCADPARSTNDNSLVLRLTHGEADVLLTGDIERGVEERLARLGPRLQAELLKVPHHGSGTSSTPQLIDAVRPTLAVISCGPGNAFGLPDAAVVARYRRAGAQVVRIDQLGAVRVRLDPDGEVRWQPLVTGIW